MCLTTAAAGAKLVWREMCGARNAFWRSRASLALMSSERESDGSDPLNRGIMKNCVILLIAFAWAAPMAHAEAPATTSPPICEVGVIPSEEYPCTQTPLRDALSVDQYAGHHKAGKGWLVELVAGFEEPSQPPRINGKPNPKAEVSETNDLGQGYFRVRPEEIYTLYSWTPTGKACPRRVVWTFEEGEIVHAGMGCGKHTS